VLTPPAGGVDATHLVVSLAFLNGWSPALMPTVSGVWNVVPGGWSVAVEVTFYLLFPLFATLARGVARALLVFALCCTAGWVANRVAAPWLGQRYAPAAVDNFLYFWFPNQMAVFALGGVLYGVQHWLAAHPAARLAALLAARGGWVAAGAMTLVFATAFVPLPHALGGAAPYLPGFLLASLLLAAFILALAQARRSLLLTPLAAAVGRVSFSAYLLHYAVIELAVSRHPGLFHTGAGGLAAVAAFAATWLVVMALTFAAAWCAYRVLERPMMAAGKSLARARWQLAAQVH
jgi:peptidoglycan/LPS O-acetylase OafA/YrhL